MRARNIKNMTAVTVEELFKLIDREYIPEADLRMHNYASASRVDKDTLLPITLSVYTDEAYFKIYRVGSYHLHRRDLTYREWYELATEMYRRFGFDIGAISLR